MARRRMAVRDFVEIYEQWQGGQRQRAIARSLGISRNTVKKYIAIAEACGIIQSGPKLSRTEWVRLIYEKISPANVIKGDGLTTKEVITPYHDVIRKQLEETTGKTIWGRLRIERGLEVSYTSFKRYLREHFWQEMLMSRVRIRREEPSAGEEAQIDFGRLGYWFDPSIGKKRLLYAFVMILAHSRHMFIWIVERIDLKNWIDAHIKACEFFDGVAGRWVIDNLKDGVIGPDYYDPLINRTYDELARHYGAIIDPCRGGKPRDKARVEKIIPYIRDSFFSGRGDIWKNLDEIRAAGLDWCIHIAGQRNHGTTGEVPIEVFRQIEQKSLKPLPEVPFEMSQWHRPKVHSDAHIMVGGALYSVPWKYIGSEVDVRVTAKTVEIYKDEVLLKTHLPVAKGKRQTDYNDYPSEKVQFYQRNPQWCLEQAQEIGSSAYRVVEELLKAKAFNYLRQCQGILRLAEKYGDKRLNAACYRAITFDVPSYRTIKNILQADYDKVPPEKGTQLPLPIGAYLHGAEDIVGSYEKEV